MFPESGDARVRTAVARLANEGLARPVLLGATTLSSSPELVDVPPERYEIDPGPDAERRNRLAEHLLSMSKNKLTPEDAQNRVDDPLARACAMVGLGWADGAVAGAVRTTGDVIRAALRGVGLAPGLQSVSSSFYMDVASFRGSGEEVLTFTDAGVIPDPSAEQLAEIATAACEARTRIVADTPRVAFLSYSTLGSAEGDSVTRMRQALAEFRSRAPDVAAAGELQADAALIPEVAARKAPTQAVAGRANVLVFPSLDAANISYKLVERLARATALGPILQGLARPVNDLSRGASADDIVYVACITALLAAKNGGDGLPVPDA